MVGDTQYMMGAEHPNIGFNRQRLCASYVLVERGLCFAWAPTASNRVATFRMFLQSDMEESGLL